MQNNAIKTSTPRKLIEKVIAELEHNAGMADQGVYQKLLQASTLLLRAERALLTDPAREWPLIPPIRRQRWPPEAA